MTFRRFGIVGAGLMAGLLMSACKSREYNTVKDIKSNIADEGVDGKPIVGAETYLYWMEEGGNTVNRGKCPSPDVDNRVACEQDIVRLPKEVFFATLKSLAIENEDKYLEFIVELKKDLAKLEKELATKAEQGIQPNEFETEELGRLKSRLQTYLLRRENIERTNEGKNNYRGLLELMLTDEKIKDIRAKTKKQMVQDPTTGESFEAEVFDVWIDPTVQGHAELIADVAMVFENLKLERYQLQQEEMRRNTEEEKRRLAEIARLAAEEAARRAEEEKYDWRCRLTCKTKKRLGNTVTVTETLIETPPPGYRRLELAWDALSDQCTEIMDGWLKYPDLVKIPITDERRCKGILRSVH